jgi:hypothetical protein
MGLLGRAWIGTTQFESLGHRNIHPYSTFREDVLRIELFSGLIETH